MNVIIIEDEEAASSRLARILKELDPTIQIIATLESIEQSVEWLQRNQQPKLIFADIQLADGPSFEIFKKVTVTAPVIFITAFDHYALQSFRFNGIDYLLKPVKKSDVQLSLDKYRQFTGKDIQAPVDYQQIFSALTAKSPSYQKRIVIKIGQTIRTVEIADVAYFFTEEKITFCCLYDGKRLPIDFNLDELEGILNPGEFFRINRQFVVHIKSIDSMVSYSKSRIKIGLKPPSDIETIVSAERSAAFKEWLEGKS